jgi:hypothetical protein
MKETFFGISILPKFINLASSMEDKASLLYQLPGQ